MGNSKINSRAKFVHEIVVFEHNELRKINYNFTDILNYINQKVGFSIEINDLFYKHNILESK